MLFERQVREQLRQRQAEAGHHVFAVERVAGLQRPVGRRATVNQRRLFRRIYHPRKTAAVGKVARIPSCTKSIESDGDSTLNSARRLRRAEFTHPAVPWPVPRV